jgi:MFS family permease
MTAAATLRHDARVIGLVGVAHGLSHFFQMVLAPLFPFLKEEFGTSYIALGSVLAVFFGVSGVLQTVSGFLVDRLGARAMLIAGTALCGVGAILAGLAPSFPWLYLAAVIGGLGNSVFHPADYALINDKVTERRLGYAFSVHGIVGSIGWALGPIVALPLAHAYGWRAALVVIGAAGIVCAGLLATQRALAGQPRPAGARSPGRGVGLVADVRLLATRPILIAFAFFTLWAMALVGLQSFATVALNYVYEVPLLFAGTCLTAYLLGNAGGVLAGGVAAVRTQRHVALTAFSMVAAAIVALVIATGALPTPLLLVAMALTGALLGFTGPSRDIIVRGIAPAASRGKVFGFVYSGMDLGSLLGPLLLGWFVDRGQPALVFAGAAAMMLIAIPALATVGYGTRAATAPQRARA